MDMLEDYLRAVARLLPKAKRDDIVAELRDEILTRIEARESELGRSLTPDELQSLLRDFGHPIVVAARYRDGPQYGVGPALYPYWIFALRLIVIIEIFAAIIVFCARVVTGGDFAQAFGQAIGSGLTGAMTLIGFVTVAAWLIERKSIKVDYLTNWRVQDLRFLDFAVLDWADISEWMDRMNTSRAGGTTANSYAYRHNHAPWTYWGPRQVSAGHGIAAIVASGVFILWWLGVISFGLAPATLDYQALHIDPGALGTLDLATLKTMLYWPVLAYFAALMAFGAVVLIYPRGVRLRGVMNLIIGLAAVGLAGWVWTSSPIGDAIRVDSITAFIGRITGFFAHPMPLPLTTIIMVITVFLGIGGFFRALGGLWELAVGLPRYPGDEVYG